MDVKEFKAWFEGFCESIGEAPTPEQFAKIKAKVSKLNDAPKVAYREPLPRTWLQNEPDIEPLVARSTNA
jgi:hypothetical protein